MRRALKIILWTAVLTIVLATGFVGYIIAFDSGKMTSKNIASDQRNEETDDRVSILLVGADQRPDQNTFSTDSIILASVVPESEQISLLSIPRDTRVELKGHGFVKINQIASLKDLSALQKTVEDLTGEKVLGYVQTNFQGFKKIIDTLGGITVNVEKDMYYETGDDEDGYINLKKGEQKLNGAKALQYARFRHDALADISRTARQQVVLKAVAEEMFQLSTIPKLPYLIAQIKEAVNTNLSNKNILSLTKIAVGLKNSKVISQTLPGTFLDLNGISYWNVDPVQAKKVVANLFQGKTTDEVIGQKSIDLLKPDPIPPKKPTVNVPNKKPELNNNQSTPEDNKDKDSEKETIDSIIVPGNNKDPNGQESPGHRNFDER